jgi:hypothetical protein
VVAIAMKMLRHQCVFLGGDKDGLSIVSSGTLALQQEFHFRYSLADVVAKRVTKAAPFGGDLLTDGFAPADLYRVTPIGQPK